MKYILKNCESNKLTISSNIFNVHPQLSSHVAQEWENDKTTQQTSARVTNSNNYGISDGDAVNYIKQLNTTATINIS